MTVSQLYSHGPRGNLLIEVTDAKFTGRYQKLFSSDKNGKPTDECYGACIEAISNNQPAGDEKVLLRTLETKAGAIEALMKKNNIVGMYCNNLFDVHDEQEPFAVAEKAFKIPVLDEHIKAPDPLYLFALASGEVILASLFLLFCRKAILEHKEEQVVKASNLAAHMPPVNSEFLGTSLGDLEQDINKAQMLVDMKRSDEAIQQLYCVMRWYPDQPIPQAFLAQILPDEYYPAALQLCRRAIASGPDIAFCHLVHARLLERRQRRKEAVAAIDEALRLWPEYRDALVEACLIYTADGAYEKALAFADRGLQLNAEDFAMLNNKARVLWQLKRYDEAASLLKMGLTIEPNDPLAHFNIGLLHKRQRQPELALHHFKIAFRLDPSNRSSRREVALASYTLPVKRAGLIALLGAVCLLAAPLVIALAVCRHRLFQPAKKIFLVIGFVLPAIVIQCLSWHGYIPSMSAFWDGVTNMPAFATLFWCLALVLLPWVPAVLVVILQVKVEESIVKQEMMSAT